MIYSKLNLHEVNSVEFHQKVLLPEYHPTINQQLTQVHSVNQEIPLFSIREYALPNRRGKQDNYRQNKQEYLQ